jgi:serine/threonine-protein kinase
VTDADWRRIEALFNQVVELPKEERADALERGSAGDVELRNAVARLLLAHDHEGSRVGAIVGRAVEAGPPGSIRAGAAAGPYVLVRTLGEGGMGSVYVARRSDDVYAAEVAVKLLKVGTVDVDAARRFMAERRILAELNHPGIARLLDGGVTDDGTPYLVMDYVDGLPIDVYCTQNALSTRGVLELFRKVCDAVQFAHGRLVVHRDLKPGNILVASNGQPKLLDFGIAKLIADDPTTADPRLTRTGLRPMTPSYASPEQVQGEPISTATDVYALGVLLYELLTGVLPYPPGAAAGRTLEDAIIGHTPAAPSVALTTREGARTTSGGSRNATARSLRGDLDTILLKALQKDPARRYVSVEQLSDDLGRHLSGLPVRARNDTLGYRVGKFVRRNRGAVSSAALSFLLISGLAAYSAWQAARFERERDLVRLERDKAGAVSAFLVGVFEASDPDEARGVDITARDILANGQRRAREELALNPDVQSEVMAAIGAVYRSLGDYAAADSVLTDRLGQARRHWGEKSPEYAAALLDVGRLRTLQGRLEEAGQAIRSALSINTAVLGPDAAATADAYIRLADFHAMNGESARAEAPLLEALRIDRETGGDSLRALTALAVVYGDLERLDESIDMSRRVLDSRRRTLGSDNTAVAQALNNLGGALAKAGRNEEAADRLLEGLEITERILPPGHPTIQTLRNNLASHLVGLQRYDEAQTLLDSVESVLRARGNPVLLGRTLINLAGVASLRGRHADALEAFEEALVLLRPVLGDGHPFLGIIHMGLGYQQQQLGLIAEAERSFLDALRVQRAGSGQDPSIAHTLRNYGRLLVEAGRVAEAEPLIAEAGDIYARAFSPTDPQRLSFEVVRAQLLLVRGLRDEARAILEQVVATAPPGDARTARARELLQDQFGGEAR